MKSLGKRADGLRLERMRASRLWSGEAFRNIHPVLPGLRDYRRTFGSGPRALGYAKKDVLIMHPGPMNRGVEIDTGVADSAQSLVLDQVEAGVAVRMAVLYQLAGEAGASPGQ